MKDPNRAPETHGAEDQALVKSQGALSTSHEYILFYILTGLAWCLEICAGVLGGLDHTDSYPFIGTVTPFLVLHWAAVLQTVWGMVRAPRWRGTVQERVEYLFLARRLQRLMAVSSLPCLLPPLSFLHFAVQSFASETLESINFQLTQPPHSPRP